MCFSRSNDLYSYLAFYRVLNQEGASLPECWVSIASHYPLSSTQIAAALAECEYRRYPLSAGIWLRCVISIDWQGSEAHSQSQPQPQQDYWRWRVEQGLPFDQADLLHSGTVEDQPLSPSAEYFILGQVQAALTSQPDRF